MKLRSVLKNYMLLSAILLLVACVNDHGDKEIIRYFKDGIPSEKYYVLKNDSTQKNGVYTRYFPNGKVAERAFYKNGVLDSTRTLYFEDGQVHVIENHKNGNFEGPYIAYFENGKISQSGFYLNNEMDSLWKTYYAEPHILKYETFFKKGMENGPFKEFSPGGIIEREGSYLNGYEMGLVTVYDSIGEMVRVYEFTDSLKPPVVVKKGK